MKISTKLLKAAAGSAAASSGGLDISDVFSTSLYEGTNAAQTITNNIDLSSEGGMLWFKNRDLAEDPMIVDTVRGGTKDLYPNEANAEDTDGSISSFNSNGFTFVNTSGARQNVSGYSYVNWCWRQAENYFAIVTWTGSGSHPRNISHSLNAVPAMMLVKNLSDGSDDWVVYHRGMHSSAPQDYANNLNLTDARVDNDAFWSDTAPTSTVFTVGGNATNQSGQNFVAYLFAHHPNDGSSTGFGSDGDSPVISCGGFTAGATFGSFEVNCGFEPQFVMYKCVSHSGKEWFMLDAMRGATGDGGAPDDSGATFTRLSTSNDKRLFADKNNAESDHGSISILPNGFAGVDSLGGSREYIYIAIARSMKEPTSSSEVFAVANGSGTTLPLWKSNFIVDMAIQRQVTSSSDWQLTTRHTTGQFFDVNNTNAVASNSTSTFDFMNGWYNSTSNLSTYYSWMWKRAKGYFDCTVYLGTGSAQNIPHNLDGSVDMMWLKSFDSGGYDWMVYHKDLSSPTTLMQKLNEQGLGTNRAALLNSTAPTSSVFTVGTDDLTNKSGSKYLALLFGSLSGISKIGEYTGNGSSQNIECGFSSGAALVILKKKGSGPWILYDSVRGINSGTEPQMYLHNNGAEYSSLDEIDPYSGGFQVVHDASGFYTNENGVDYIFYAIAA